MDYGQAIQYFIGYVWNTLMEFNFFGEFTFKYVMIWTLLASLGIAVVVHIFQNY